MTQDNIPIALKESDQKHSIWGIISLAISIYFIMGGLLTVFLIQDITQTLIPLATFYDNYFIYPVRDGVWLGLPLSLILALNGLKNDRKRIYSIWSLWILGIFLVILVGLISYFFYVNRNGIG